MDEPEKAYGLLKKAFARHPKDVDVLVSVAYAATLLKRHNEALHYGTLAVKASPTDERAHLALIKAGSDCPLEFRIDEVTRQDIQQSLAFLERQPSGYVKAIPVEPDLKSFIAMAKARADYAHKVEDLVREKNLPMSFLSEQLGLSPFQAWSVLTRHPSLHVFMSYGTTKEQVDELGTAHGSTSVCMELFALMTMCLLKQMQLLPRLFGKIHVHTGAFEAIVSEIRELETRKSPFFVSYHDGKLVRLEIPPEQIQRSLSFLKEIREFLRSQTELIGIKPSDVDLDRMSQATTVLGKASYETILAAKERGTAYFCDDAPMRSLAATEFKVSGFCTQALLRSAKERNILTESQYEECIVTLIKHNYYFVYETGDTLVYLIKAEGFKMSETLNLLLCRVADPKVNRDAATRILSDFCLFIWGADYSNRPTDRDYWLGYCIGALLKAKEPEELFIHFVSNLAGRTLMNPELFYGVTGWILRCKALSTLQRGLFYLCVQQVILQMCSLVTLEAPWVPSLRQRWRLGGRINVILSRNGLI